MPTPTYWRIVVTYLDGTTKKIQVSPNYAVPQPDANGRITIIGSPVPLPHVLNWSDVRSAIAEVVS